MKGILVTIVDVLGVFVPGFLLFIGILIFPPLVNDLFKEWPTWSVLLEVIRNNILVISTLTAVISYGLGFLLRLCSVRIMQLITWPFWTAKLEGRAKVLEVAVEAALKDKDKDICQSIREESKLHRGYELAYQAPYFHFAKRIIRGGNPGLWAEAERLEAELRFAAGIFIPLVLFAVDGFWIWRAFHSFLGILIGVIASIGILIVYTTFPSRRIREVVYDYYLALIVLRYSPTSPASDGKVGEPENRILLIGGV